MNALAPITDKLSVLIPRLASDKDGEVVATARAIGRQLSKNGSDWHDLAAKLTAPVMTYQPETESRNGGVANYREAVAWIIANDGGYLTKKERKFVVDMQRNLRWGSPSTKQGNWLDAILEKMGGRWV